MDQINSPEALVDIARRTIGLFLSLSLPILFVALIVGLFIGLIQAMTQIQEPTLVFVPKVIAVTGLIAALLPYIGGEMADFYKNLLAIAIGL